MFRAGVFTLWFSSGLFLFSASSHAQNTNDINAGIQFEFAQPGARSQAIGGAFVAVADDATTVFSNPAGLPTFTQPEISGELRHWNWNSTIHDRGHAYGRASGNGLDTLDGVVDRTFNGDATDWSFASFVYPRGKWGFGVFGRALARYEMEREPQGIFFDCKGESRDNPLATSAFCEPHAADGIDRQFPAKQWINLEITSLGGAAGYRVSDTLSVGVGLQFARLEMGASNKVFSARGPLKFLPPDFTDPGNLELVSTQDGGDSSWAWNAGLLWNLSEQWSVGAAFQAGPRFTFHTLTVTGPQNLDPRGPGTKVAEELANPFKVPDHYALGAAFRPNPNAQNGFWLMSVEYDRVNFGQLMDDIRETGTTEGNLEGLLTLEHLRLDDANRVRGGLEYVINLSSDSAASRALALRAGVTYDPQHQMYFRPNNTQTGMPDPRAALYFPKGKDDLHLASGLGLVFGRVQFDAAFDFADAGNTVVLSTVFRFRR